MVTKIQKFINVSDFRKNLSRYLKEAKGKPLVIATDRGRDTRVVIDTDVYNELVEAYENQIDSECLTDLVENDQEKRVLWNAVKKEYDI